MHAEIHGSWVPAAVASDVLKGTVVPATLPSGPIAVWRSASGQLNANGDRCPHRGMRLSHGFVRGETLACIYHGWRFGQDGACVHIPAHPDVVPPKTINCGPLPVREANGVVWVAPAPLDAGPPTFAGFEALRSLVMAATPAAIVEAGATRSSDGILDVQLGALPAHLLISPRDPGEVFVVALAPSGLGAADQLKASSALEAFRRAAEAIESETVSA